MDRRTDDRAGLRKPRLHDEKGRDEAEHVQLSSPRIALVRHGPKPNELDAADRLSSVELVPGEALLALRDVTEAGSEDRHRPTTLDELPRQVEVARAARSIGGV